MSHENIMRLWNDASVGGRVRPKMRVINKTADYTLTPDDYGAILTTRGATSQVTFTLAAAGDTNKGDWAVFANFADVNMFVGGASGGLVIFNDLTADNIGYATSGELIGGMFLAISDGTSWIVMPLGTETQTVVEASSTSTATPSGTSSSSFTSSATGTSTATPTGTASSTSTASSTTSVTWSISGSDTASHTQSASASSTGTATSTSSRTSTSTSTPTGTSTATPSSTGTSTSTATSTGTP